MARDLICSGAVLFLWMMITGGPGAASAATLAAHQGVIHLSSSEGALIHELQIESGKSISIKTGYTVKRVSVGNPEVLDVAVLGGRELQLVGKAIGATNLLIWDSNAKPQAVINVHVDSAYTHVERALRAALGHDSIEVQGAGNAVIL